MDLQSVITSTSYSPMALGHLPRPVPNDLPPGLDPKVFTFQDAFEDLIVASRGQKLPDIRTRHQQRQLLWNMFPTGEPAWFWLRRLESQGLVRPFDPFPFTRMRQPELSTFYEEHSHTVNSVLPWRDVLRDMFAGDDARRVSEGKQRDGPNTFDEIFSVISSAVEGVSSALDTVIGYVVPDFPTYFDKKEVLTTEEDYVDQFGYRHRTVTRKTLDATGKEVASETHTTIRPANEHINKVDNEGSNQQSPSETRNSAQESTWFWK
ncbi:hypothetical protein E4U42_006114 [Claviceps africana]|uniref:Uncharacterized protein n=1 Tax=Claviceps africana TaxID=83212 RepID=A0A8K0JCS2_9HYPO|nr:hypothetical protein E4U42_006114 [Claviceps africana]